MKLQTAILLAIAVAVGIAVMILGAQAFDQPYEFQGSLIDPPMAVDEFTLMDQNGEPFRISEQNGAAVLLFFGYTYCPDVCPATLANFRIVRESLGSQADRVRFVFVTVDPERDTPVRLQEHLARFDPAFVGLTGDRSSLEPVWQTFFVFQEAETHKAGDLDYLVSHTSRVYLVDASGNLRLTYPFGTEASAILEDLKHILDG